VQLEIDRFKELSAKLKGEGPSSVPPFVVQTTELLLAGSDPDLALAFREGYSGDVVPWTALLIAGQSVVVIQTRTGDSAAIAASPSGVSIGSEQLRQAFRTRLENLVSVDLSEFHTWRDWTSQFPMTLTATWRLRWASGDETIVPETGLETEGQRDQLRAILLRLAGESAP
jgi:hypothetical protein